MSLGDSNRACSVWYLCVSVEMGDSGSVRETITGSVAPRVQLKRTMMGHDVHRLNAMEIGKHRHDGLF